ncbi:MAG: DAPG hydrolase family protein [Rhodococcus sp. (in: high G+C Gram-positive bacteria)]
MSRGPTRRRVVVGVAAAVTAAVLGTATKASAAPVTDPEDCAERYQGYRDADRDRPYARYLAQRTTPAPAAVADAYAGPALAPSWIPGFDSITTDLAPTGYSAVETGYGRSADGATFVAVRTVMPRVTAAMWDWWFGWHSTEAARYKLWHPDAHLYAALAEDRTALNIPDKAKYIGNTTFVDEYVGPKLQQLGIGFRDPVAHGFEVPADQTVVFGRVGSSIAPVDLGWLAHQVRPVEGGAEMRSRFHLNLRGLHLPDMKQAVCAVRRGASVDPTDLVLGIDLARDLMLHCGQEMSHLAGFLPELYAEFSG